MRCYTQNIDGLEARAGLEVGIPARHTRSSPKKGLSASSVIDGSGPPTPGLSPSSSPTHHPPAPRCIPLHGQLTHLYCQLCPTIVPLASHLPLPPYQIPCPTCHLSSSIRHALSERQRKVGSLRASVVLYGEEHPQGELIGSVVERDLRGIGRKGEKEGKVDLLLVAGTSLAIPGVKRIVKEMARSLAGPSRSPGGDRKKREGPGTILVNREIPKGAEWEGIFDTFISGDIQDFTTRYLTNLEFECSLPTPSPNSERYRTPKKRKAATGMPPTPDTTPSRLVKSALSSSTRTLMPETPTRTPTTKRRRVDIDIGSESRIGLPLTPRPTPPNGKLDSSAIDRQPRKQNVDHESDGAITPILDMDTEENPFLVAR